MGVLVRFIVLGFVAFLFIKAATGLAFPKSVSLIYALIYAVLAVGTSIAVNIALIPGIQRKVLEILSAEKENDGEDLIWMLFVPPAFAATVGTVVLAALIVPGFSPQFSDKVIYSGMFGRLSWENVRIFGALLAAPVVLLYIWEFVSFRRNFNGMKGYLTKFDP